MKLRLDRRTGTWLALIAVWGQLVLSLGHIAAPPYLHVESLLVQALEALTGAATPAEPEQGDDADDCAACWLLTTAGALALPVAAVILALTLAIAWTVVADGPATPSLACARRSRAPPPAPAF